MEEERNETAPSAFEPLNDVLATYGLFIYPQDQPLVTSKQKSAKHGRLFGAILLCTVVAFVTFIVTGAVKVEAAKSAQKSVGETTACWKEGRPVSKNCEPDETTVELTFFNVTNPHGVLDGDQPRLLDVGPYVLQSKRFRAIVESDQDQSTVSEIFNSFMSFDTDRTRERCPQCNPDEDEVITPNLAWTSLLNQLGGSDMPLLWERAPKAITGVLSDLQDAFKENEGSWKSFVDYSKTYSRLAYEQWGTCEPLMGLSINSFQSMRDKFPHVPEACAFDGQEVSISRDESEQFNGAMKSLEDKKRDARGDAVEKIVGMSAEQLTEEWDFLSGSELEKASLLQGYINHMARTYGADELRNRMNDLLGPSSGGAFVKRSVRELVFGWNDPLMEVEAPEMATQRIFREDDGLEDMDRLTREAKEAHRDQRFSPQGWMQRTVESGQSTSAIGLTVREFNGMQSHTHQNRTITARGTWTPTKGLFDALDIYGGEIFLESPIPMKEVGHSKIDNLPVVDYNVDKVALRPCDSWNPGGKHRRCTFPPGWQGLWNITKWNEGPAPGYASVGRMFVAEPNIKRNLGNNVAAMMLGNSSSKDSEWRVKVEPFSGALVKGKVTSQMNALFPKTGTYSKMFAGEDGYALIPSFEIEVNMKRSSASIASMADKSQTIEGLELAPLLIIPALAIMLGVAAWDVSRRLPEMATFDAGGRGMSKRRKKVHDDQGVTEGVPSSPEGTEIANRGSPWEHVSLAHQTDLPGEIVEAEECGSSNDHGDDEDEQLRHEGPSHGIHHRDEPARL